MILKVLILTEDKAGFKGHWVEPGDRLHPVHLSWYCIPVDLFGWRADDLQQEEEDLDHIDVDGESAEHILLRTNGVLSVPYEQLRVVRQEQSESDSSHGRIKHVKPVNIFERQHDRGDDAGHKHHNPEDTEEALALGEVHLWRETTDGHVD